MLRYRKPPAWAEFQPILPHGSVLIKASEILDLVKKHALSMIDFRFVDIAGAWRHTTVPAAALTEGLLASGIRIDPASLRGRPSSDLATPVLRPDLASARIDRLNATPTLAMLCDLVDPDTGAPHGRDPRAIARRAQEYLRSTGIADTAHFGAVARFYIFESGSDLRIPAAGLDALRSEIALELAGWDIDVETHNESVAGRGQAEIRFRFDALLRTADNLMVLKYVVKRVASRGGYAATFMPKPLFDGDGSGMPAHQSLSKDGKPLFFDANGYAQCSQTMLYYIGGLLHHAPSVLAFAAPATNSYRRLTAHGDAPVNVAFSARNRTTAIGVGAGIQGNANAKRIEFRPADASANPYLAFAAMLLAGIDGIKNKIDPVRAGFGPLDRSLRELAHEEAGKRRVLPTSLAQSLDLLAADHAYLLEGGVFAKAFIDEWIAYKTGAELLPVRLRPHPHEYGLYFDC